MNKAQRVRMRQRLRKIKIESGCIDCGYKTNADGLDFDHRDPLTKLFNVSQFSNRTVAAVEAEIGAAAGR